MVATFNIRNGRAFDGRHSWPLRRRSTAATLRRMDADVVGLQEVYGFQQRYLLRRLPEHEAHGEGRSGHGRGERCPILVRRSRLDVVASRVRWFGAGDDSGVTRLPGARAPRIATCLRVHDRSTGVELDVVNTHLDERLAENRRRSIEQLVTWLDRERPTVVMGDLNSREGGDILAALHAAGLDSVLPADAGGTAHRFTGRTDGPRIDHVLVSRHWEVRTSGVVVDPQPRTTLPSDHWPVSATLRLHGRGRPWHTRTVDVAEGG